MRRICVLGALVAIAACGAETDVATGKRAAHIQGGNPDIEFDGVCAIKIARPTDPLPESPNNRDIECSCSLVGPGIVLTAASCVEPNVSDEVVTCRTDPEPPCLDDIDVRFGSTFGNDGEPENVVVDVKIFRYYNPAVPGIDDVALIRLADTPPEDPPIVAINDSDDFAAGDIGQILRFVGYGETKSMQGDFGTRRVVDAEITAFNDTTLRAGAEEIGPCRGDNGGPGFYDFGGGFVQATINAGVGISCAIRSQQRVAPFVDFIYTYVDAHTSNCQVGDGCDTGVVCDRSPDPDCDPCLEDGQCAEEMDPPVECPTRDFDCPLGAFPGEACTVDSDCERDGACIAADDDTTFTYCTRECNPDAANTGCGPGQECVGGTCKYGTPSPGSQGFPCASNEDCRSGICEERICVEECNDSSECLPPPEGEDPYTCTPSNVKDGVSVCLGVVRSGGGGFCTPNSVGGSATGLGGVVVLLLGAVALVFITRRRS